jgi:hypothetical protein
MTCAICGEAIDLELWYALILDYKVHSNCFKLFSQARARGERIDLKPNCIIHNLINTANEKLSDSTVRTFGSPKPMQTSRPRPVDLTNVTTWHRVA